MNIFRIWPIVLTALAFMLLPEPVFATHDTYEPSSRAQRNWAEQNRTSNYKLPNRFRRQRVSYRGSEKPGTIIVDTRKRYLFLVGRNGKAMRYGIGVGRQGFSWKGTAHIRRKTEWPDWYPPEEMRQRELKKYGRLLPKKMKGGPNNPLGARALYLFQGNKDTLYRLHGTNQVNSIGRAVSSGCIRLLNTDVIDLYRRVRIGAKVVVR